MILMLGDIHGNFEYLKILIKDKKISNCDIIQVGDFGVGFTSEGNERDKLNSLNKFLRLKNIMMYAIRGNHDDPSYFNGNYLLSNLHLIPDYTILDLTDNKLEIDVEYKILCIGGAVSIDRKPRLLENMSNARYGNTNKSYWYDEKVVFDEEKLNQITGINVVVTHTAPEWCVPDNRNGVGGLVERFAENDEPLKGELKEERELMSKMFNILQRNNNITDHFYGHYHRSDITYGACTHRVLAINEFYEL